MSDVKIVRYGARHAENEGGQGLPGFGETRQDNQEERRARESDGCRYVRLVRTARIPHVSRVRGPAPKWDAPLQVWLLNAEDEHADDDRKVPYPRADLTSELD